MRRLLTLVLLVAVLLGAFAIPANASLRFCSTCDPDPIFNVGGHQVSVLIQLSLDDSPENVSALPPVLTVLFAPRGTDPYVQAILGAFPERAFAFEWWRHDVGIFVRVPALTGFEAMRVTVSVDGRQVRQVETRSRFMFLRIPWSDGHGGHDD